MPAGSSPLTAWLTTGPAAQSVAQSTPSSGSQSAIQTEPIPVPRSEARLSLVPCFLLLPRLVDLTRSLRVVQSAVWLLEGLILHLRCLLPVGRSQPPNTSSLQRVPASQHPQPAEGPSLPTPPACRGSQPPNTLSLQRVPASTFSTGLQRVPAFIFVAGSQWVPAHGAYTGLLSISAFAPAVGLVILSAFASTLPSLFGLWSSS